MKSFLELGIIPPILKALEEMGFSEPTPVQERAIPHILNHEDLIVMSKTGSGKTAVFGVSLLQLIDPEKPGPQGLILTPTRELAVQVDNDLKKISTHLVHQTTAVYGQHSMNVEVQALKKGVSVVTGTPGRVFDHIRSGHLNTRNISFLVLDEADRMLDMGFIGQVEKIIRTLPKNRISLLFSATIPPEVKRICTHYMRNPVTIEIESQTKTVDTIEQAYYRVNHNEKRTQLNRLLLVEQPESCIIFCNTRIAVDQVQSFLTRKGYASHALHGDIAQGTRLRTMQQFKQGDFHILVATDVAARGIHIDDLSLVINYDIPVEKDSYIHRIGRTGRAGNGGRAISLVTGDDLMTLYEIEEHIGALIEEAPLPSEEEFNERLACAEQWLKANALKSKPSQQPSDSSGRDAVSESNRRKPSGQRGRSNRRPTPSAQGAEKQELPASRDQQGGNSSRGGSQAKPTRKDMGPQKTSPVQEKRGTDQRDNSSRSTNRPSQQANRQSSDNRRQPGYQPGSAQRQMQSGRNPDALNNNRKPAQSGAAQSGYSRSGQSAANRQTSNARVQNGQNYGYNQKHSVRQESALKKPDAQNGTRTPSGYTRQSSYGRPGSGTTPARPQAGQARGENRSQSSGVKKESFIKRIFYRIFGK